jgi:hypothetical protein
LHDATAVGEREAHERGLEVAKVEMRVVRNETQA